MYSVERSLSTDSIWIVDENENIISVFYPQDDSAEEIDRITILATKVAQFMNMNDLMDQNNSNEKMTGVLIKNKDFDELVMTITDLKFDSDITNSHINLMITARQGLGQTIKDRFFPFTTEWKVIEKE